MGANVPSNKRAQAFYRAGIVLDQQLQPAVVMSFEDIGKRLGIKRQLVYWHVIVALGKVALRMRKAVGHEG